MSDSEWSFGWSLWGALVVGAIGMLFYVMSNCEYSGPPVKGPKGGYSQQCVIRK